MPEMDTWKQKAVALAGFGAEFLAIPAMFFLCPGLWMIYGAVAAAHIAAYKFYAGEESDFKWI
jgi:hypothetical protein